MLRLLQSLFEFVWLADNSLKCNVICLWAISDMGRALNEAKPHDTQDTQDINLDQTIGI